MSIEETWSVTARSFAFLASIASFLNFKYGDIAT